MFLLHEETHHKMDSIRAKFFWGSDGEKFKYHMVKWENTCLPKDLGGGAGIINTRILNEALVLKWLWRLKNADRGHTCFELLRNKYLRNKNLASCKGKGVHNFGRDFVRLNTKLVGGETGGE
jgi:hypothetical protein